MKKIKSIGFLLPPFLMAIFPILSFYLNNITELSLKFIGKPFLYSTAVTVIGTLLLFLILKNKHKASLIVSLFTLIFFSYGHLSKALNSKLFIQLPNQIVLGPDKVVLPAIVILFLFICYKITKSKNSLNQIITFINVSLLLLVGYLSIFIAKSEFQKQDQLLISTTQNQKINVSNQKVQPDIYYIVLDGYARQDILNEIYDYDNSEFINELKKMGFYVADSARSNYLHTFLSLPSTLNMRYLDELPQKYGIKPVSITAARQLTSDNEVTRKLKSYGYTTINFASAWEGTDENYKADVIYKKDRYFKILGKNVTLDEASITFLQTTLLSPLISEVWNDVLRVGILTTLQKLPTIPYQEGRKFVVAHIIIPHPPYIFDAQGGSILDPEFNFANESIDNRPKYLNQLIFISNQIIPVLQKIIQNSKRPPVIVLQSDHGPGSILGKFGEPGAWLQNYTNEGIRERSSILYAIYLPDQNYRQFYKTITPVNTFRLIFNHYFNEKLETLPGKTFYSGYENMYGFKDVTDVK